MSNPFGAEVKDMTEIKIRENIKNEFVTIEKMDMKIHIEEIGLLPRNGGEWSGEQGNSDWLPDSDVNLHIHFFNCYK